MTWSARVTKQDGTIPEGQWSACNACKHNKPNPELVNKHHPPCQVAKIASSIGSILTSIDMGADGHMASGSADLKCSGFEPLQ